MRREKEWFETAYKERWRLFYEGMLPPEITVFGHRLTRKQYLALAGIGLILLMILGFYLNRRWIRKEIASCVDLEIPEP